MVDYVDTDSTVFRLKVEGFTIKLIVHLILWVKGRFRSDYLQVHSLALSRLSYNHHIVVRLVGYDPTTPRLKADALPTELQAYKLRNSLNLNILT